MPEALRARQEAWQFEVLEYAETIPEVIGTSMLVRNSASKMKLLVRNRDGSEADFAADPIARDLQHRLDKYNIGRATELIFLVGEQYTEWPEIGDPGVLSINEAKLDNEMWTVRNARGGFDPINPNTQIMRVWRESTSNRFHAISPHKAALELLKAMYAHQLADTGVATSRLAGAGILFWPTTLKAEGLDPDGNPYPNSQESLLQSLHGAMMQSITKRDSKDAIIPFIQMYDPMGLDVAYKPELLRIDREDQADMYAERFRAYEHRYAVAIELPLEAVEGMGQTNHWSAWQIDVDKERTYITPMVQLTVDALNEHVAYRHGYKIVIDGTELTKKPDQTETIMQIASLRMATPESIKLALVSGKLEDLVMVEPPEADYVSTTRPTQPSDFTVNGDRGGGRFRDAV